jgi:hypothetical protein
MDSNVYYPDAIHVQTVHEAMGVLTQRQRSDIKSKQNNVGTHDTIEVCFGDGNHLLEGKAWSLPETTPSNILWKPTTKLATPIISGGQPLNKWYPCNKDGRCPWSDWEGVWVHYLTNGDVPGRNASSPPVRNLWVDGKRMNRMSTSGTILGQATATETGFELQDQLPVELQGRSGFVEFLWPRQIRNWIEPRCAVFYNVNSTTSLTVDAECWATLKQRNNGNLPPIPVTIENIAGPPGPGEFSADNLYLFYRPDLSNSKNDKSDAPTNTFIAGQELLMEAEHIHNHTWINVSFEYSTWNQVNEGGGYVPSQSTVINYEPLGAARVLNSTGINFLQCNFEHIGSPWALSVTSASQNVLIENNVFDDLSGGAVKIGNIDDTRAVSTSTSDFDSEYTLADNSIANVALEYRGASAIFAGYVMNTIIEHNTIVNISYTGISLGWGWGRIISFAKNNVVQGNRLENVMQFLNDGGCIYTLGPQPNSTVRDNYCKSDKAPVVGCFYHDNGSRYFTTTGNVAEVSPAPCVYLQGCCNAPAYDINVTNLYCRQTAPVRNGCQAENCLIDANSLFYVDANSPWPFAAQVIVNNSGTRL